MVHRSLSPSTGHGAGGQEESNESHCLGVEPSLPACLQGLTQCQFLKVPSAQRKSCHLSQQPHSCGSCCGEHKGHSKAKLTLLGRLLPKHLLLSPGPDRGSDLPRRAWPPPPRSQAELAQKQVSSSGGTTLLRPPPTQIVTDA